MLSGIKKSGEYTIPLTIMLISPKKFVTLCRLCQLIHYL